MKSLLDLPEAYLNPAWRTCAVPGRPWWRMASPCAGSVLGLPDTVLLPTRYDGAQICVLDGGNHYKQAVLDLCVNHDAEHPLPHPGFRPGQAWLIHFSGRPEPVALLLDTASARLLSEDEQPDYTWAYLEKKAIHAVLLTGVDEVSTNAPPERLGLPGGVFASYLVYDPFRPDLAPWSSR